MPSLREALQQTHQTLEASGIADARLEAEVMVMNVMQMPRQDIFAQQELAVSSQQQETLSQVIDRRKQREPLAYILSYKEFYGVKPTGHSRRFNPPARKPKRWWSMHCSCP